MKKYIEAGAFIAEKRALYCEDCDRRKNTKGQFCYEIGEAPCRACEIDDMLDAVEDYPAADVQEVTRCKDCWAYETAYYDGGTKQVCRLYQRQMQEEDFCSYGAKMDGKG